jgi:hypothetical protein
VRTWRCSVGVMLRRSSSCRICGFANRFLCQAGQGRSRTTADRSLSILCMTTWPAFELSCCTAANRAGPIPVWTNSSSGCPSTRPGNNPRPRPLSFGDFELLVSADSLRTLDEVDGDNIGLSDIWLTQAFQGGRISETLKLRLGCVGLIGAAQPYIGATSQK